jgi:alpha-galactosidase
LALGYNYINLDDCWAYARDKDGNILPDPNRFPSGMKSLADYLHSKGFLFGLYTDAGTETCSDGERNMSIPGSYGHYDQDAKTYAAWGMDFVKMDWCNTDGLDPKVQYPQMTKSLNATGRPIFFSMCEWGLKNPWLWAQPYGNSWRTGGDHKDNWKSTAEIIEHNAGLSKYAGPGGWNDLDFVMTGGQACKDNINKLCPGQTDTEYITEFTLWAIMNSPLLVATDARIMNPTKSKILFNTEVIALNQDKLAKAGDRVGFWHCSEGDKVCQIWAKPLFNGDYAIVLYNSGEQRHNITANFSLVGIPDTANVSVRDLWQHKDLGVFKKSFTGQVDPHGTILIRVKRL